MLSRRGNAYVFIFCRLGAEAGATVEVQRVRYALTSTGLHDYKSNLSHPGKGGGLQLVGAQETNKSLDQYQREKHLLEVFPRMSWC